MQLLIKNFFLSFFVDICFETEKPIFFKRVFYPLKVRMGPNKKIKIRIASFELESNILKAHKNRSVTLGWVYLSAVQCSLMQALMSFLIVFLFYKYYLKKIVKYKY